MFVKHSICSSSTYFPFLVFPTTPFSSLPSLSNISLPHPTLLLRQTKPAPSRLFKTCFWHHTCHETTWHGTSPSAHPTLFSLPSGSLTPPSFSHFFLLPSLSLPVSPTVFSPAPHTHLSPTSLTYHLPVPASFYSKCASSFFCSVLQCKLQAAAADCSSTKGTPASTYLTSGWDYTCAGGILYGWAGAGLILWGLLGRSWEEEVEVVLELADIWAGRGEVPAATTPGFR